MIILLRVLLLREELGKEIPSLHIYILVLCLERFSQLINREVEAGFWKPFKVSRRGPTASHLCFTDNMLLFAEASESQINQILHCLLEFIW
jgi:hypothetical protein